MTTSTNDTTNSLDQENEPEIIDEEKKTSKELNEVDIISKYSVPMWQKDACIQENDLVILFENHHSITYTFMKKNEIFQNRHGAFHHNDMIGMKYGTKIYSRISRGWMYMLSPTPELWSKALHHRTQIVFTPDASIIMFNLNLKPGDIIIESGTGSGSLSTTFARSIAPTGHVYTFEFNSTRAEIAREEFKKNGLDSVVTVECRDVCSDGFNEDLKDKVNAVFLDLPCPWVAVPHAYKLLKYNGAICSYSPCIEQVQRTCDALRNNGFDMVRTLETRLIPYNVCSVVQRSPDFGDSLRFPNTNPPNDEIITEEKSKKRPFQDSTNKTEKLNTKQFAKKELEMRGHTAFLTFGFKFHAN